MHQTAYVTGVISFKLPAHEGGANAEVITDYYSGTAIEFGGALPVVRTLEDDNTEAGLSINKYKLGLRLVKHGTSHDGSLSVLEGVASVEDILSIEFPNQMSMERARNWLAYYHADEMQDIEIALFRESEEECEMVRRLAEVAVDVCGPHRGDLDMTSKSSQALNLYTNSLFTFDREVPYIVGVNGFAWEPQADGTLTEAYANGKTMAVVDRVLWLQPVNSSESTASVKAYLSVNFLHADKDAVPSHLYIPIEGLTTFESLRHAYFHGNTLES
jgi:hypothetical protein